MASGTQLFLDIMARDHASATFNKVAASADALGRHTDKAGRSHTALGKAARWAGGMLSVYGVAQYLKSSVQEYAAAETAQNKLGRAYEKFPAMQNRSIESFKALNTELMAHTRFDDDDTAVMQANLARFDLTGSKVQSLTPLIADLAQAQGTDMVAAGKAFGKATLGNTRALKDLGISYTATGNRAKDLRNVIRLLNEKVGGEAANAAGTSATKLAILENQLGELKETSGEALQPLVTKLAQVAGPAIEGFGDTIERNMPQIEQTFEDVWKAGSKIAGVVKGIWDAFSAMPPGVRDTLLLLGGGTMAYGKLKGSALGTGVSSIFSGVKTITAGNVTVVGKTVTGTPGGAGGKPGAGAPLLLNPLTIASVVAAAATYWNTQQHKNDPRAPIPIPGPGPMTMPGNAGRPWVSKANKDSDWIDFGKQQRSMDAYAARMNALGRDWEGVNGKIKRATGSQIQWGEAAKQSSVKGILGANAFAGAVGNIPDKKHTSIKADGADESRAKVKGLGGAIGGLKGKTVPVKEAGAEQSKGRVTGLKGSIGGLKGKTVKVSQSGAEQAKQAIDNMRATLALLQSKTVTINTRYTTSGGGPGKPAMKASGGYISGPGTATSDSIPLWASDGEFMQPASSVSHYGVGFMEAIRTRRFPKPEGFRKGGKIKVKGGVRGSGSRLSDKAWASFKDMLDAMGEYDSYNADVGYRGMRPDLQQSRAQEKIAAARAVRSRKGASDKEIAKSYRDEMEWLQRLDDANQAAADAEAARQAEQDATREKQEAAEDAQLDKVNQLRDAVDNLAGGYRSFASISTTAVTDVTEAQSKLTDANDAVAAAQKKMDLAGSDRERAAAAAELSKALAAQQTAQQGVNEAGKPTSASIRGNMAAKLAKIKGFSADVKKLKDQGLNATTLSDILAMGPEQGADFAKALLDGGLGDINELQNQITQESASLGYFQHGQSAASDSLTGYAAAQAAGLVSDGVVMAPAPVTVSIDGNAIAQALISYKRQNGGSTPGLNL